MEGRLAGRKSARIGEVGTELGGIVWTTSYQLPPVAILLRKLNRSAPYFAVTDRDLAGGNVCVYATPHYILASRVAKTQRSMESPGNWQRLVFDDMNAVFFPLAAGQRLHIQHRTVCISCWIGGEDTKQTIEFTSQLKVAGTIRLAVPEQWSRLRRHSHSGRLSSGHAEKKNSGPAKTSDDHFQGCAPLVVLQAGDVHKFGSFEQFQEARREAPCNLPMVGQLHRAQAPGIEFLRPGKKAVDRRRPGQSRHGVRQPLSAMPRGDHQVTVRFGRCTATYDFETNLVKE